MSSEVDLTDVTLQVPIVDAVDWEPWLSEDLSLQAEESQIAYDGGEESGGWEEHLFLSADPDEVREVAERVLRRHGERREVNVVGSDLVRVEPTSRTKVDWIVVRTTADTYGRAVKDVVRELNADAALRRWMVGAGVHRVLVQQSPVPGAGVYSEMGPSDAGPRDLFLIVPVDLSFYDRDGGKIARADALSLARGNLRLVIAALAAVLRSSPPSAPEIGA